MKRARPIATVIAVTPAGCGMMWPQLSTTYLRAREARDFPQCVAAAIAQVPDVSIDYAHSTEQIFVLATPLQSGSGGPIAYVTPGEDVGDVVAVQVRWGEWGMREPEWRRKHIAPLLKTITARRERHCTT